MEGKDGGNVPVLILMLFVNGRHQRSGGWQHLVDEDEDGLLGGELDALADDIDELAHGEVRGYQILLFVDRRDVGLLDLLADDGDAVAILLTLWKVLVLMAWRGLAGWRGSARAVLTMRSASALRFSKGCSSLNLDRMMTVLETRVLVLWN
jgi:hypothetical protein